MTPATLLIVGAGGRGTGYARWTLDHRDRLRVVAVAEPREFYRRRLVETHDIPPENVFTDWRDAASCGRKLADAAVISTQDAMHAEPAIALADQGYHLLLEKPLAPTADECRRIVQAVQRSGILFAVGHVLRYTAYTRTIKRLVASGAIGEVMSVEHLEPVGYWHYAHSYVRGNWRKESESSSMLLAKSCHDLDWLRYVVDRPARRVSSFGSLRHFRPDGAPDGAADRCLDCPVQSQCPYSAVKIYLRAVEQGRTGWPVAVIVPEVTVESVREALRTGPYGRCVYRGDNDVVDHQVVNLEFDGGATGVFTMCGFTQMGHRRTRLFGTRGQLTGDGRYVERYDFLTDETETIDTEADAGDITGGHGGGDDGLMTAFAEALNHQRPEPILSGPGESLESHLTVFAAEDARRKGTVEPVPPR